MFFSVIVYECVLTGINILTMIYLYYKALNIQISFKLDFLGLGKDKKKKKKGGDELINSKIN